ncbi:MAG: septal ring lytic transglycosylase RlpA family protein [Aquabacterium sp.]|uniref:septal ring lytic transglycosylase RlpA family protein n=1 Tax=Aquabacterium sp. TaxID=1872578 RepID=UPI00271615C4|nr:septal ring lytic transglycosylase RlpA family protein [Aquabacterium sp.]MDO9002026.1 septal ring lytic transglycosylase RlpA family protein [Aquabacterium sp.]
MSFSALRSSFGLSVSLVIASILAGCASGPGPTTSRSPAVGRDGPPAVTPADLVKVPDAEPRVEPIRQGGPNKPYSVMGQSYAPMSTDVPWKQRGLTSWYGQKFHGRRTASGELFSIYGMTAAHRTLPIPSYARVRHIASGKEVIVRINDRGPFHSARVLDLSYAAALKLGIVAMGSAEVELERLTFDDIRTGAWRRGLPAIGPEPGRDDPIATLASAGDSLAEAPTLAVVPAAPDNTAPSPVAEASGRAYTPAARGFWVQLAALGRREGVDQLQQRVSTELSSLTPLMAVFKEAALFRLQVGPYESREQAQGVARSVREVLALNPMVIERR